MITNPQNTAKRLAASDHVDSEGSIVRSGMMLAEAVLGALDEGVDVTVSFEGLKGASSSYFNVFLRRIDEGCGIAEINEHIHLEFSSKVHELVYERSFALMAKVARKEGRPDDSRSPSDSHESVLRMLLRRAAGYCGGLWRS